MCVYDHVATNFVCQRLFATKDKGSTKQPGVRQGELLLTLCGFTRPALLLFLSTDLHNKDDPFYQNRTFSSTPTTNRNQTKIFCSGLQKYKLMFKI